MKRRCIKTYQTSKCRHGIIDSKVSIEWHYIHGKQETSPTYQPRAACVLSRFSRVWFLVTPWTVARQAPVSMGILQARILELATMPSSGRSSQPMDWTLVSCLLHWQAGSLPLSPPGKPSCWPQEAVQSTTSCMQGIFEIENKLFKSSTVTLSLSNPPHICNTLRNWQNKNENIRVWIWYSTSLIFNK